MTESRLAIGMMTGTSIDALDASLVRAVGAGLDMRVRPVRHASFALGELSTGLRELASGRPKRAEEIARLALAFGELHADAALELAGGDTGSLELIAVHGQTVYHHPPASWQFLNAHPIAARTGVPVVHDLRQIDLALGGAGAPITPLADRVLFADLCAPWAVVNLGGFCNVTIVDAAGGTGGRDVCACNQLLDGLARELLNRAYDENGASALRGWARSELVAEIVRLLEDQASAGRSLGTGDELEHWCLRARDLDHSREDVLASAGAAIAQVVAAQLEASATVVIAGGGAKNPALVGALKERLKGEAVLSESIGIPVEHRESMAMAVLGLLCADRVPVTLPGVTGRADAPLVSGAWVLP